MKGQRKEFHEKKPTLKILGAENLTKIMMAKIHLVGNRVEKSLCHFTIKLFQLR